MQFRGGATEQLSGAVDTKAGRITGVSLMTADREAAGHGMWVDARTNETFREVMADRKIKAYATHGMWGKDGTLDEVGYWSGIRIDGQHLRADFQSLAAWRKHNEGEFDTLFEIAATMPEEFGASLAFRFNLAWVRKDGSEVPTEKRFRYLGDWEWEEYFVPPAPVDALREMPSVRCVEVYSADFVDQPAANDGLFRAAAPRALDAAGNGDSSASTPSTMDIKALHAKFGTNPARLQAAIALFAANDKLSLDQIESRILADEQATELAQLRGVNTQFTAFAAALDKAGFKAAGEKSALDVLLESHAAFKAKADAADKSDAALKTAGFEAKDGKSATELALAALTKAKTDIATLRSGGSPAVETGGGAGEGGSKPALKGVAKYEAALKAKLSTQNKPAN